MGAFLGGGDMDEIGSRAISGHACECGCSGVGSSADDKDDTVVAFM